MQFEISVNMEFIRSEDKSFEDGVRRAADLGYRELLSEAGYFHSFSMDNDPLYRFQQWQAHPISEPTSTTIARILHWKGERPIRPCHDQ